MMASAPAYMRTAFPFEPKTSNGTQTAALATADVASFATDDSSLPNELAAVNGSTINDRTIAGLLRVYLSEKRADVQAGSISAKMYAEHSAKLEDFADFAKHFQRFEINQVDSDLLAAYRTQQLEGIGKAKTDGGISRSTARKRLQCVHRFLTWTYKREALGNLPRVLVGDYQTVKRTAPNPLWYTPKEIKNLYKNSSPRLRAAILLGLNCGYTQVDVATLTWEMIDQKTRVVSRKRNKSGTASEHRLWPFTLKALQAISPNRTGLVLTGPRGPMVQSEVLPDDRIKLHDQLFIDFRGLKRKLEIQTDPRSFKHLRKSAANEVKKKYQETPHLTTLFLAHSKKGMDKHYAGKHYDLLFKAIDYLDLLYNLGDKPAKAKPTPRTKV